MAAAGTAHHTRTQVGGHARRPAQAPEPYQGRSGSRSGAAIRRCSRDSRGAGIRGNRGFGGSSPDPELKEPELPWHTQRDNLVETAQVLALLVGTLGKFAKGHCLANASGGGRGTEPTGEGRGGSSTMPQKQNPVACAMILASAARVPGLVSTMLVAMSQEHERGLGLWQAEWETLPEIFRITSAALSRSIEIAEGLQVDAGRMASNLDAMLGLPLSEAVSAALASKLGRSATHEILRKAVLQSEKRESTSPLF